MNKKYITLISLIIVALVGSLFVLLASNMLGDDLFNKGVSFSNMTILVSLPAVAIATMFVLGVFYLIRTYRHPVQSRSTRKKEYTPYTLFFDFLNIDNDLYFPQCQNLPDIKYLY